MHRAVQQTCAPLNRACVACSALLQPNSNNTASGATITAPHESLTLPAAKEGARVGRDAVRYAIGILKLKIIITIHIPYSTRLIDGNLCSTLASTRRD